MVISRLLRQSFMHIKLFQVVTVIIICIIYHPLFISTKRAPANTSTQASSAPSRADAKVRSEADVHKWCCLRNCHQRAESRLSVDGSPHQSSSPSVHPSGQTGQQSSASPSYRYNTFTPPSVKYSKTFLKLSLLEKAWIRW